MEITQLQDFDYFVHFYDLKEFSNVERQGNSIVYKKRELKLQGFSRFQVFHFFPHSISSKFHIQIQYDQKDPLLDYYLEISEIEEKVELKFGSNSHFDYRNVQPTEKIMSQFNKILRIKQKRIKFIHDQEMETLIPIPIELHHLA